MIKKMDDRPKCPPHFGKNAPPPKNPIFSMVFFLLIWGVWGMPGLGVAEKSDILVKNGVTPNN